MQLAAYLPSSSTKEKNPNKLYITRNFPSTTYVTVGKKNTNYDKRI